MNDVLLLSSSACRPPAAPVSRLRAAWARLWQRLSVDEREAYLAGATDCADLERRLRAWDAADRAPGLQSGLWS